MSTLRKSKLLKEEDELGSDDSWCTTSEWETESESENSPVEADGGKSTDNVPSNTNKQNGVQQVFEKDSDKLLDFTSKQFKIQAQKFFLLNEGEWKETNSAQEERLVTKLCSDIKEYEIVKLLSCCKFDKIHANEISDSTKIPPAVSTEQRPVVVDQERCYCNPWKRTAARYLQLTFAAPDIPPLDEIGESTKEVKSLLNMLLRLSRPPEAGEVKEIENSSHIFLVFSENVVRSLACMYKTVCNTIRRSQLQVLNDSFANGKQISIPLKLGQTMQEILAWYLDNQSGKEVPNSYCTRDCVNRKIKVNISVADPNVKSDSPMCFRSYRKYMVTHVVTKSMMKSGYDVNFIKLTANAENIYSMLISDVDGKDSTPFEVKIGEIASPDVSGELLDLFQDQMTEPPTSVKVVESTNAKKNKKIHPGWKTLVMPIFTLQNVTFNYDILCRSADSTFNMQLPNYFPKLQTSIPRSLYSSYNRLYAILKVFKDRVEERYYEPPPDHRQTWSPTTPVLEVELRIIQLLFEWPAVLADTVDVAGRRENINRTLLFMKEFNDRFETLYLNHPILLEAPSKHRIQKMYDQLYLLKIIATVYLDFFELLMLNRNLDLRTRQ